MPERGTTRDQTISGSLNLSGSRDDLLGPWSPTALERTDHPGWGCYQQPDGEDLTRNMSEALRTGVLIAGILLKKRSGARSAGHRQLRLSI